MATTCKYQPDYAVPLGSVLEEHLEVRGLSHAEFARRCGQSAKLIGEIIAGKAPVEPAAALQFEKALGMGRVYGWGSRRTTACTRNAALRPRMSNLES